MGLIECKSERLHEHANESWMCEWMNERVNNLKGSVKEPNKFHIYETEKITLKTSDMAEYIELFGSFTQDHHARLI